MVIIICHAPYFVNVVTLYTKVNKNSTHVQIFLCISFCMVNRKRLIMNTALLTGSSLAMSAISMAFQVWLAARIGSAGIGLYQLVLSVAFLCTTFAVSGIRFAATRLVSEELGHERSWSVAAAMRRCFAY
ncbi:MAG TPA: hypothetical protein DIT84_05135, partial [Clostridiales bacterium]|nr:hypothetical protein [Clostridiales bacterium]